MLIRRCTRHRQHFGYAVILGIAEWGGHGVAYTDGICRNCATLERRRLVVGDSATAAAARGLRRRAVSRVLAVVFTAGLVSTILSGDPDRGTSLRLEGGARWRPPASSPCRVCPTSEPSVGQARPAPQIAVEAPRDRVAPITTLRLAGQRVQSFHQLAQAADVALVQTAGDPSVQADPPSRTATPHAPSSPVNARVLAALRSVFEQSSAEPPTGRRRACRAHGAVARGAFGSAVASRAAPAQAGGRPPRPSRLVRLRHSLRQAPASCHAARGVLSMSPPVKSG